MIKGFSRLARATSSPGHFSSAIWMRASLLSHSDMFGRPFASHVFVSDGTWAFDHDGWTLKAELLAVTAAFDSSMTAPGALTAVSIRYWAPLARHSQSRLSASEKNDRDVHE
jgi:hypothetical protein